MPSLTIRPAVELSDTTDYWRRLTNELRAAIIQSLLLDENLVNSFRDVRFLKFAETINQPISVAPGTYITTKQTIEPGGSLTLQQGARIIFLDKPVAQTGVFRDEYLVVAATSYFFDIPSNATGHFYVTVRVDGDRVTSRKYFFVSGNTNVTLGTPEILMLGADAFTSVSVTGLTMTVIPSAPGLLVGSSSFINITTELGYTPPEDVILPEDFVP